MRADPSLPASSDPRTLPEETQRPGSAGDAQLQLVCSCKRLDQDLRSLVLTCDLDQGQHVNGGVNAAEDIGTRMGSVSPHLEVVLVT